MEHIFSNWGKMNWFSNYSYRTICGSKVVVELLTKETNLPQETTSQNNNLLENFSKHVHNRTLMNLKDLIWKAWGKKLYDNIVLLLRYVKIVEKKYYFCFEVCRIPRTKADSIWKRIHTYLRIVPLLNFV